MPTNTNQSASELPGVSFEKGSGGLPKLRLHHGNSTAEIYLHGAHVTHFQHANDAPILWMSTKSRFENNVPIRGGVPIIFPWFGPRENAGLHGFARVTEWELVKTSEKPDGSVQLHFNLPENVCAKNGWPAAKVDFTVTVHDSYETKFLDLIGITDLPITSTATAHLVRTLGGNPR